MTDPTALAAGAGLGLGVAALAWWLIPAVPDPLAVLERRRALAGGPVQVPPPGAGGRRTALLEELAGQLDLPRYAPDLDLVGESTTDLIGRKLGYAVLGLAFPPLLVAAMAVLGLRLPLTVPVVLSLGLAAVLFFVPDLDLRHRAAQTRADLRHVLCVYLELVALERAADAGSAEALERAAAVGDSRFFVLVRDELVRAQLAGEPAWRSFERLAERIELVELSDVADIMRLTGEDGAAVYGTLRARAASLRTALLNEQAAKANAASEQMVVPVALLGIAFLLLLGYPAFARIVFG